MFTFFPWGRPCFFYIFAIATAILNFVTKKLCNCGKKTYLQNIRGVLDFMVLCTPSPAFGVCTTQSYQFLTSFLSLNECHTCSMIYFYRPFLQGRRGKKFKFFTIFRPPSMPSRSGLPPSLVNLPYRYLLYEKFVQTFYCRGSLRFP